MKDLSNENVIHVKEEGVEYLQFRRLLEYDNILTHCFTLKNLDFKSNDTMQEQYKEAIENYQKISKALNMEANSIVRPYQTHTDHIRKVDEVPEKIQIFTEEYQEIDGLVTNRKKVVLSLGYADCIPLYFFDPVKKVMANIHSGWKGTVQRIGVKAVEKMREEYGCIPQDIICCIGPSIGACHFEVEEDVYQIFHQEFEDIENEVIQPKQQEVGTIKYYIDTVKINQLILEKAGLKKENIIPSNICSVCHSDLVHSYRADKQEAGRNTALMMLK